VHRRQLHQDAAQGLGRRDEGADVELDVRQDRGDSDVRRGDALRDVGQPPDEFERAHGRNQGGGVPDGSSAGQDGTGRITALFGVHESRAPLVGKGTTTGACRRIGWVLLGTGSSLLQAL